MILLNLIRVWQLETDLEFLFKYTLKSDRDIFWCKIKHSFFRLFFRSIEWAHNTMKHCTKAYLIRI